MTTYKNPNLSCTKHHTLVNNANKLTHIFSTKSITNLSLPFGSYFYAPVVPTFSPNLLAVKNLNKINLQKINLYVEYIQYQHFFKNDSLTKQILVEKPLNARVIKADVLRSNVPMPPRGVASSDVINSTQTEKISFFEHYNISKNTNKFLFLEERARAILAGINNYGYKISPTQFNNRNYMLQYIKHFTQEAKVTQLLASVQIGINDDKIDNAGA